MVARQAAPPSLGLVARQPLVQSIARAIVSMAREGQPQVQAAQQASAAAHSSQQQPTTIVNNIHIAPHEGDSSGRKAPPSEQHLSSMGHSFTEHKGHSSAHLLHRASRLLDGQHEDSAELELDEKRLQQRQSTVASSRASSRLDKASSPLDSLDELDDDELEEILERRRRQRAAAKAKLLASSSAARQQSAAASARAQSRAEPLDHWAGPQQGFRSQAYARAEAEAEAQLLDDYASDEDDESLPLDLPEDPLPPTSSPSRPPARPEARANRYPLPRLDQAPLERAPVRWAQRNEPPRRYKK